MAQVNQDIGEIKCAWCGDIVPVRKNRNGKLYPACPNCGQQPLNAQGGQDIILERATIYGAGGKPTQKVDELPPKEEKISRSVTLEPENDVRTNIEQEKPPVRTNNDFSFLDA